MLKDEHFKAVAKSIRQKIREFKETKEQEEKAGGDLREAVIPATLTPSSEMAPLPPASVAQVLSPPERESPPVVTESQPAVWSIDLLAMRVSYVMLLCFKVSSSTLIW